MGDIIRREICQNGSEYAPFAASFNVDFVECLDLKGLFCYRGDLLGWKFDASDRSEPHLLERWPMVMYSSRHHDPQKFGSLWSVNKTRTYTSDIWRPGRSEQKVSLLKIDTSFWIFIVVYNSSRHRGSAILCIAKNALSALIIRWVALPLLHVGSN